METTEVEGLRITYERAGNGPPLVLLHGYVGDGPVTWRPQLDGLGDEFTVIAWNAPGAGGSSDPPESFGTAWDRPTSPASPSAASLPWPSTGATPPSPGRWPWPTFLPKSWSARSCPRCSPKGPRPRRSRRSGPACAPSSPPASGPWPAPRPRTCATSSPTSRSRPCSSTAPRTSGPPSPSDLDASIPTSTLAVLPGVGHVCNLEAPDEFNRLVRSFLRGTVGA